MAVVKSRRHLDHVSVYFLHRPHHVVSLTPVIIVIVFYGNLGGREMTFTYVYMYIPNLVHSSSINV